MNHNDETIRRRPVGGWLLVAAFVAALFLLVQGSRTNASAGLTLSLQEAASGLVSPTDIAFAPDSGQMYVTEKRGTIQRIESGAPAVTPFLDISDRVSDVESEQGLLGLVFHPDFATNRYFYVNYTDNAGDTHIARFTASPDGTTADPNSEFTILFEDQPYINHNAGDLAFGPDGYLYVPLGDGGGSNDPAQNAQDPLTLLGTILRLDVDGGSPYAVPSDNPFVGDPDALDEIWAFGLRNPWRISFDRLSGDLYIGDVGEGAYEEVNFQAAGSPGGENYGWSCFEGAHPNANTSEPQCQPASAYAMPVAEYGHAPGNCAITGGYVYRGSQYPAMTGRYFFTDWCSGFFWDMLPDGQGGWLVTQHDELQEFGFVTFGEDNAGELYVGNIISGKILHLRGEATNYASFLPLLMKPEPVAPYDLVLTGLEASQSVQNESNTVPLISNRDTMLRIYAKSVGSEMAQNVMVAVAANRNGNPLPDSPLVTTAPVVPFDSTRDVLNSSVNVLLPASWLSGNVQLTVSLDPENEIREPNEGNNSQSRNLIFANMPPLDLRIVPVTYQHTPTGQTYPAPTVDTLSDWLQRSYPVSAVNAAFRTPYFFSGNLYEPSEWPRLLNELTTLKLADGSPPGQFYYALVPVENGNGAWFSGGIAGVGWIGGQRAAVGLDLATLWHADDSGQLAAHEIGHNLNRRHAPCGNPAGVDPNYPYANGKIGQHGLDLSIPQLWNPNTTYDIMSYCGPEWVSDYTYNGFYTGLLAVQASARPAQSALLVRAIFDPPGAPVLMPVYELSGQSVEVAPEESGYRIDLLNASGEVVASQAARLLEAEEPGVRAESIQALIAMPDGAEVHTVRLFQDERLLAERSLAPEAVESQTEVQSGTTLRWDTGGEPVLVRYLVDGATLTLAVDATGNELDLPQLPPGGQFEVLAGR